MPLTKEQWHHIRWYAREACQKNCKVPTTRVSRTESTFQNIVWWCLNGRGW